MPKCEITLRDGCSPVNLLHIFRTRFTKSTSGWLLLLVKIKFINQKIILLFTPLMSLHESIIQNTIKLQLKISQQTAKTNFDNGLI